VLGGNPEKLPEKTVNESERKSLNPPVQDEKRPWSYDKFLGIPGKGGLGPGALSRGR